MKLACRSGSLELIVGPMFAGKTTEMMRRVQRHTYAQRKCFIIKYSGDIRYSRGCVTTHDGSSLNADIAVSALRDVGEEWRKYNVIAVDEGQFFPDVFEFCNGAADEGKTVIVSALDGDYKTEPFDNICKLIPRAESVVKLNSVCMACRSSDASFIHRTVESDERELIGGADMYMATCRSCYRRLILKNHKEQQLPEEISPVVRPPINGRLELIVGPMFAGKTTEMIKRVQRHTYAQRKCFIIKYSGDVRYSRGCVTTHDGSSLNADIAVSALRDVGEEWRKYNVIAVDEGQFFPDVFEFCNGAADEGKTVIVSALDGDYKTEPFDNICKLIPRAESVVKLNAVCMACRSSDASFTHRTVESDERELVGGADMYMATCRSCYKDLDRTRTRVAGAKRTQTELNGKNTV